MIEIIIFISIFLFIFAIYLIYGFTKIKRQTFNSISEYRILIARYKIAPNKYKKSTLVYIIAFANAFIITNTIMLTTIIKTDGYIWMLLLAVLIIIILIVVVYGIIGKILGKKK